MVPILKTNVEALQLTDLALENNRQIIPQKKYYYEYLFLKFQFCYFQKRKHYIVYARMLKKIAFLIDSTSHTFNIDFNHISSLKFNS